MEKWKLTAFAVEVLAKAASVVEAIVGEVAAPAEGEEVVGVVVVGAAVDVCGSELDADAGVVFGVALVDVDHERIAVEVEIIEEVVDAEGFAVALAVDPQFAVDGAAVLAGAGFALELNVGSELVPVGRVAVGDFAEGHYSLISGRWLADLLGEKISRTEPKGAFALSVVEPGLLNFCRPRIKLTRRLDDSASRYGST